MFKATISLSLWLSPFGNWSERYIQISVLMLLGKIFNTAYSIVMLKPRPLPSERMLKLVASPNQKCELGNQTYTKRCSLCSRTQHLSLMRLT